MVCNYLIRRGIAKYEAVYFVGDNQAINRVRVESYKTRNRGAFSGSLAALVGILVRGCRCATSWSDLDLTFDLAVVTLAYKMLSGLYLGNCKVWEVHIW